MTNTPYANSSGFEHRLKIGLKFESRVERILGNYGFLVCRFGLNTLPKFVKDRLICLNDATAKFVRYLPDRLAISENHAFFVECKDQISKTQNYTFNLEEFEGQLELAQAGLRILVIFPGFKSQWIERLLIARVFTDSDLLHKFNGSRKPFVLIPKTSLPDLDSVIKNLKQHVQSTEQKSY